MCLDVCSEFRGVYVCETRCVMSESDKIHACRDACQASFSASCDRVSCYERWAPPPLSCNLEGIGGICSHRWSDAFIRFAYPCRRILPPHPMQQKITNHAWITCSARAWTPASPTRDIYACLPPCLSMECNKVQLCGSTSRAISPPTSDLLTLRIFSTDWCRRFRAHLSAASAPAPPFEAIAGRDGGGRPVRG